MNDIYCVGASIVLGIDIKDVTKLQRQSFKESFFNFMCGYLHGNLLTENTVRMLVDIFAKFQKETNG